MNNGDEQIFKCKIGYYFYIIKIFLNQREINIEIESTSIKTRVVSRYINNYTLSHFKEINSYFKLFNSLKDIYKNIRKLLLNKKFFITENEDSTLSFILKIQINDKFRKIKLALSKYKNPGIFNQRQIFNENNNNIDNINNELYNIGNKINSLEQNNPYMFTYSNNYLPTNKSSNLPNNEYAQLQTIISKMTQLENENNDKNKKIEMLEKQINKYENNNSIDDEEEEESDDIENINDYNKLKNSKNNIKLLKNSMIPVKNSKINRNSSFDKLNSINSNFEPKIRNVKNYNNYIPNRDNSMDIKFNNKKNLLNRNDERNNKLKSYISMEQLQNNYEKTNTYMLDSKYDKYINTIRTVEKEKIPINSKIIFTKKELKMIKQRISEGDMNTQVELKLLYRATSDGDFETNLKFKCDKKLITLTLFYTMEGARFGFYIERRIKTTIKSGSKILEIPGTSFIIGLNYLVYYNVRLKRNALFYKNDNLLCFGYCNSINNNKTKWLVNTPKNNFIGKKCLFGDKNDVYLYLDTKKIVGKNLSYHIKDVEIFEVILHNLDEE